jgi:hypothetical protein
MSNDRHSTEHQILHLLHTQAYVLVALIIVAFLLIGVVYSYTTGQGVFAKLFSSERAIDGAQIVIGDDAPNFGSVSKIESKTITVSNTGSEILAISAALPSCECLSVTLPPRGIEPGKKEELQLTFDPAKSTKGKQSHIVTLTSNAHNLANFDLVVSANVK